MKLAVSGFLCVSLVVFFLYQQKHVSGPVGVVVPHHDMVADTRAAYFEEVSRYGNPESIIVISPDHFDRSRESIVVSDKIWETSLGNIESDTKLISELSITVHNDPFLNEHGITSLLTDIRRYFSESKIVPILINRNATYEDGVTLARILYQKCPDCLLVASVDFSHTNDAMVADLHDTLVMRGLSTVDSEMLYKEAEVDSPEALVVLTTWASLHNQKKFQVFSHTNSGFLSGIKSGEMTTHIMGGYYKGDVVPSEDAVTFLVGGDLSLSRGVDQRIQNKPDLFNSIGERFFWGTDVSLLNLEGYFSRDFDRSVWYMDPPLLPISTDHVRLLDFLRLKSVNLANNHSGDGGIVGHQETIATLESHAIGVIGDNQDIPASSIHIKKVGDVAVAFIGVYTHRPFSNLTHTIKELSGSGHYVVVYAHWGEEYANVANSLQQDMAHDWIDAGADLIIGSHPHVVQKFETYNGKPIAYSLGNFVFDQGFSDEVQVGAVLGGKFTNESLSLFVVPIHSYLEPSVVHNDVYNEYVGNWATGWEPYRQESGYFKFEL